MDRVPTEIHNVIDVKGDPREFTRPRVQAERSLGTTPLTGSGDVVGFWIEGNTVIGPDIGLLDVRFYKYPAGGKHTKVLPHCEGSPNCVPYGAAISLAK